MTSLEISEAAVTRIVIVEDSEVVRRRLADLLGSTGNEVVGTAEGVQEALELIWRTLPDAVILDLRLKDGSGMAVLELVKKTYPKMTVVVLTNHGTDEHRVKAMSLGADRFLDKTADFDQIPAAVTL